MRATYNLDTPVPGTRAEGVFPNQVPVNSEHLPLMFLPRLDRELVQPDIEQLYRPIARGNNELVLMRLGPGQIVESILCIEPEAAVSS